MKRRTRTPRNVTAFSRAGKGFMKFRLLLLSLVTLPFGARAETPPAPLEACFTAAAQKWSVPVSLLKALAKEESDGFHNIPDARDADEDHLKTYGIMGLHDDKVLGHSLPEAAALLKRPVSDLVNEPCANIEGASALLGTELKRNGNNLAGALQRFWGNNAATAADGIPEVSRLLREGSKQGRLTLAPAHEVAEFLKSDWASVKGLSARKTEEDEDDEDSDRPANRGGLSRGAGTDYPAADWDASANFTAGAISAKYIVMHTTEGGFAGAVSWLKSSQSGVSAHYVIRKSDGYVKQLVHERDRAFHARCWNVDAIGIEMEGYQADSSSFPSSLLNSAAQAVSDIARRHGIPKDDLHVIGHNFGQSGKIGQTPLQNCNDHADPGPYFPWTRFFGMLGGRNGGYDPEPPEDNNGYPTPAPNPNCRWWKWWCR